MTMFAEQGCFRSRSGRATALGLMAVAGCLAFGLGSSPAEAQYRSQSGITVNTDVLDSLGPGPAPMAPLPLAPPPPAAPPLAAPENPGAAPLPQFNIGTGNSGGTLPQRGDGAIVVTRPGTLLFPPLRDPSSSLTPGFSRDVAEEQRKQAFDNAFADGPEPQSQLLLPLANADSAAPMEDEGEWIFQTVIIESKPIPQPSPRKPAPSPAMLAALEAAEQEEPGLQEAVAQGLPPVAVATAELPADGLLAPEFRDEPATDRLAAADEAANDARPESPLAETSLAETPLAEAETTALNEAAAETPASPETSPEPAPMESAQAGTDPVETAERSVAEASAPVSLLPQDQTAMPGEAEKTASVDRAEPAERLQQVASLSDTGETPLAAEDISFVFDTDSAELSTTAQATLRSLAEDLRGKSDDRIQVLGFASSTEGSPDLARQLALSRALKVRTFLIDAGIPSARIQVRPPSNASGSGPANRVDIKPVGS